MIAIVNKILPNISEEEALCYSSDTLILENCIIGELNFTAVVFHSPVIIRNCVIAELKIHSTWFSAGMQFVNNVVMSDIIYEMGGHNNQEIMIVGNVFKGFFCFFDCVFSERLVVKNNIFVKGSDLLYKDNPGCDNVFDGGIIVEDNIGQLDTIENSPPM